MKTTTVDALLHRARRAMRNLRAGNPSQESLNAAANIIEALLDERYPLPPVTGEGRTTPLGPEDERATTGICCWCYGHGDGAGCANCGKPAPTSVKE